MGAPKNQKLESFMYEKSKTNTAAILADRQTVTINVVKNVSA